ncbi:unnamed protein product [Caenorhabditis angaria]|uniref:Uncharacterized protein n=1 Tax=Caenorhabditis angaria TaxID=860376 RepID=A0A9P1MWL9_9PELO|nr:unnamed protein product [Caenorhabditis angaria]
MMSVSQKNIFFAILIINCAGSNVHKVLFEFILGDYNHISFPPGGTNNSILIEFKLKIDQIVDVHEKNQVLTIKGMMIHKWFDKRLSWDPSEHGGVKSMHLPGEMIWLPDIILYNNAHGSPWVAQTTQVDVTFEGEVLWSPPVVYNSFCGINIEWYPYDTQTCELKFGSWTYGGSQLNLIHLTDDLLKEEKDENNQTVWRVERGVDISNYQESVEWDLLSYEGIRHKKWYPCCDYPSIDLTYYLKIRRKKLFYTVNLVIPCVLIALLTLWVFYLPCESHQKIQLCISILVSLTIYFLIMIDIIPPTSIVTPLILKYLSFTMIMVTISVTFTVLVQRIHYRTSYQPMSPFIKYVFINRLGKILLISRRTEKAQYHRTAQHLKQFNAMSAMNILERQFQKKIFEIEASIQNQIHQNEFFKFPIIKIRKPSMKLVKNRVRRLLSSDLTDDKKPQQPDENKPEIITEYDSVREKLRKAERNIHFIARTLTVQRKRQEDEADWKFVSLIIDRILLILFSLTTITGTLYIFISSPDVRNAIKHLLTTDTKFVQLDTLL